MKYEIKKDFYIGQLCKIVDSIYVLKRVCSKVTNCVKRRKLLLHNKNNVTLIDDGGQRFLLNSFPRTRVCPIYCFDVF